MLKNNKILGVIIVLLVMVLIAFFIFYKLTEKATRLDSVDGYNIVPTMSDNITKDSVWCGTCALVWNDFKNELIKQDIIFNPQEKIAENLNKEEFTEDMLSQDSYYKVYGINTVSLKEEIEKNIRDRFSQDSDILNSISWINDNLSNSSNKKYIFYTMLYKDFEFINQFDKLDNAEFGKNYNNIEYFGIDDNTDEEIGKQLEVLYYTSKDEFAIIINTKTDDEVILCKSPKGKTFNEIYNNMKEKKEKYSGSKYFNDLDELKIPKLNLDVKKEYDELKDRLIQTNDSREVYISDAIQTIKLKIDENGGKLKSEAIILAADSAMSDEREEKRYFYLDDTFAIFIREKGKKLPYFAARIDDITKFQ